MVYHPARFHTPQVIEILVTSTPLSLQLLSRFPSTTGVSCDSDTDNVTTLVSNAVMSVLVSDPNDVISSPVSVEERGERTLLAAALLVRGIKRWSEGLGACWLL